MPLMQAASERRQDFGTLVRVLPALPHGVRCTENVCELLMGGQETMKSENKRRVARALAALRGTPTRGLAAGYYDRASRSDCQKCPATGIFELLCDLRHLCDTLNLDFEILDTRSGYQYLIDSD